MKEKLLVTVLENLESENVKEYKEVNSIDCLTEVTDSMLDVLTMSIKDKTRKRFDKKLRFEKMLSEIDGIELCGVIDNKYHARVVDEYQSAFDIFANLEALDGQKYTGEVVRGINRQDDFEFLVKQTWDDYLIIELLDSVDFIEYGAMRCGFKELKNLNTKKYKGIKYHKVTNNYSGNYYTIEVENDSAFTPILNKLIRFNLRNNNIHLKSEKEVKEYINFILDDVNFINDLNVDYISYKTQKELTLIDGVISIDSDYEYIIRRGFEKEIITGIKDIEIIKEEFPLTRTIRATIYIGDDVRKLRIQEYIDRISTINVAQIM